MGQISIAVSKKTAFRGATQHFGNTYTYRNVGLNPTTESGKDALIEEIVSRERQFHSSKVTFVEARMWSSGGTRSENEMLRVKLLSGTGSGISISGFDPERAVLLAWPAGKDRLGRPVYLRKWYHCVGNFGSVVFNASHMDQSLPIGEGDRTTIKNLVLPLTRIGPLAEPWGLTAESGRERTGDADPICHRWLEHHQFGDEWR